MTSTNELTSPPPTTPPRQLSSRRPVEPMLNSLALKKEWEHSLRIGRALTRDEAKTLHDTIDAWRSIGQSHAAITFAHTMINDAIKVFVETEKELSAAYKFDVQTDVECEKDTTDNLARLDVLHSEREFVEQIARAFSSANLHLQMAVKDLVALKRLASDTTKGGRFRKHVEAPTIEEAVTVQQNVVVDNKEKTTEEPQKNIGATSEKHIEEEAETAVIVEEKATQSEPFPSVSPSSSQDGDSGSSEKKKKRSISVSSRMLPAVTAFALRRSSLTPSPLSKTYSGLDEQA